MTTGVAQAIIVKSSDFVYSPFDWGRVAEPVGPATGAEKVTLNVVDILPGSVWRLGWALEEENVVVVFRGDGHGDVTSERSTLRGGDALYSPTGRTLELRAGDEGLLVYVWRTRLRGDEPRGENPRISSELGNTETQLRGFTGTGEVPARDETAVMNFVFWPGTGSSRLCLHCGTMRPGQTFNVHTHPESEEAFIAFEGRGRFYLEDGWYEAEAGDVLFAPPGVPHGTSYPEEGADAPTFVTCGGPTPFDPVLYARAGVSAEVR
ncbi:hypothetical protein CDG81_21390 [Actinopolyspora erythraea]|uniref:Cupin type-2 domain-containing protein n=1 Tax=Actinopolyspora erythraea TaxID=414996 RepID=A0A099DB09_9ACTN|nr:hypothetical protein CDG81_21390 [Actinopolyspora erythraea]KGI82520.1 hypothetical protein IL38_03495 [Actinopolyspora erythraea]